MQKVGAGIISPVCFFNRISEQFRENGEMNARWEGGYARNFDIVQVNAAD
jgi:hypothetical protein